jgi:hypothetical protein
MAPVIWREMDIFRQMASSKRREQADPSSQSYAADLSTPRADTTKVCP